MVATPDRAEHQEFTFDANALKTNQSVIVATVVGAFVLGTAAGAWLVLALAVALAAGAVRPGVGPIQFLYRRVLLPLGIFKSNRRADDPAPHRFAQGMGGGVLALAAILLVGWTTAGLALAWIVVTLALANLVVGFCTGCFVFLQLRRAGLLP